MSAGPTSAGRPHRAARAAVAVAAARLCSQPLRPILVVAGVALAFAFLVAVLGGSLVSRQQALARTVAGLPESDRSVRVDRFGLPLRGGAYGRADRLVRRVLGTLSTGGVRRVVFFRELRVQGEAVEIAGLDGLAGAVRLRSGRLPRTCTAARCEVLQIGGRGRGRLAEGDVRLDRVGIADLRDPGLFDYVSAPAGNPVLLLGPSVDALQGSSALAPFYRVYSWLSPLRPDRLHTWDVPRVLAAESRAQTMLDAADPAYRLGAPDEALRDATDRGRVAAHRLVLVGGATGALLLGFALIAAAGLRRGLAAERRRLLARGARRWLTSLALGAEVGAMTLAGAAAGVMVGSIVVAVVADAAGQPAGAVLRHALLASRPAAALAGGWLATTLALALTTFARDAERRSRRIGATDVAALGAAAAVAVGLSRGALDSGSIGSGGTVLLLLLPALVSFATAVVLARLLAPAMRALERLTRGASVSLRLAVLALARAPARTVAGCAFVAVAVGLALFSAAYRATLGRGAADQAAFQVPLDFTLSEGQRLVLPRDAAPLTRYEALGGGTRAYPVVRTTATVPGSGASVLSPTVLGVPADGIRRLRWRSDFSPLRPGEIAARLAPAGEPRPVSIALPAGSRTVSVTASLRGIDVVLGLVVVDGRGRVAVVPLGRLHRGTATVSARVPRGRRVLGLQLALPESEVFTFAHREAEGEVAVAPAGVLDLGPLRTDGGRLVTDWSGWSMPAGGRATRSPAGMRIDFAFADTGARLVFRPRQPTDGRPMPVVTSPGIARAAGGVGRETVLDFQDTQIDATIVGVARRMPTVPADTGPFVLADGGWLSTAIETGAPGEGAPTEIWLSAPGNGAAVAAALRRPPFSDLVVGSRAEVQRALAGDPLAHATVHALGAAAVVALALAVLGVWVGVAGELRDERSDFFDLEAQGVAPERLRAQVRTRGAILVVLGLAGGVGLGALLSVLVVSLVRISGASAVPEPPLRLDPAWLVSALGVLALAVAALAVVDLASLAAFRSPRPERASWSVE